MDKENDYFMRHASPIRDEYDEEEDYLMGTGMGSGPPGPHGPGGQDYTIESTGHGRRRVAPPPPLEFTRGGGGASPPPQVTRWVALQFGG